MSPVFGPRVSFSGGDFPIRLVVQFLASHGPFGQEHQNFVAVSLNFRLRIAKFSTNRLNRGFGAKNGSSTTNVSDKSIFMVAWLEFVPPSALKITWAQPLG